MADRIERSLVLVCAWFKSLMAQLRCRFGASVFISIGCQGFRLCPQIRSKTSKIVGIIVFSNKYTSKIVSQDVSPLFLDAKWMLLAGVCYWIVILNNYRKFLQSFMESFCFALNCSSVGML